MERFKRVAEDKRLHDALDKKIQETLEEATRYEDILSTEVDAVESLNKELLSIKQKIFENVNAQREGKRAALETIGDYKKSLTSMLAEAKKECAKQQEVFVTGNGKFE